MTAPGSERIHISIFGSRNAGKSTLANELLGQNLSIVSDTKGTTTDPVSKTMELLPLGPVVITDTAGYDDEGELGGKRVLKTKQIINKTDIAILVINKSVGKTTEDQNFENILKEQGIPYSVIFREKKSIGKLHKILPKICATLLLDRDSSLRSIASCRLKKILHKNHF